MMKSVVCFLLAVMLVAASAVSTKVRHLTNDDFARTVSETKLHFIKFYAPWCGHCTKLAPTWDKLAIAFEANPEVEVEAVDCTKNRDLCTKYKIPGYPTLKLFFKGEEKEQYRGDRKYAPLEEWLKAQSKALLATVDDA